MSPQAWSWLSLVLLLLGASLGMGGVLMMSHAYHPFSLKGLTKRLFRLLGTLVTRGPAEASRSVQTIAALGAVNDENRAYAFLGLIVVFFGFLLQLVGTVVSFLASVFADKL